MSSFNLPPVAGFGEWGPSFATAKAPVVYNQAIPLRASLWFDQDAAKPEQELREEFLNKVFSKQEQVALQERLVAYVKDIKDAEAATKRTQYDKAAGRFNAAARDQYHDVTKAVSPSQIKGVIPIDTLWAPKAAFAAPKAKTLLHVCGRPPLYNDFMEKAKFSAPIPLREDVEVVNRTPITGDEIVAECVSELNNEGVTSIVVTSDEVLATIMAAPASVNSWDIEVLTAEGLIFIDRRDGGNTSVEWVNENANGDELPSDTTDEDAVDSRAHLGAESTKANFAFNVQCAAKGFFQGKTEPLREDTHSRKIMYRYYQYIVNEDLPNEYYLIVRSEVDIAEKAADGSMKAYRAFGLLEFVPPPKVTRSYRPNPSIAWSDSAALSVLLVDVARKNVGKVTRWIIMSYLSDANMKIGFITRKGDAIKTHAVGGVTTISPHDFARSINIDFTKLWSSLSTVVEAIIKSKVEQGGIIRQGGEKQLRIFADEPESDDDDDSDEEDEDDDSDDSDDSDEVDSDDE